jgi:hypothetical protein
LTTLLALVLSLVTLMFIPTGLEAQKSMDERERLHTFRNQVDTDSASWYEGLLSFLPASAGVSAIAKDTIDAQLDAVNKPWYNRYSGNTSLAFFASSFVLLFFVCIYIQ